MFVVRPVTRDDLPAVLALSERTGTGLTTLPADAGRLAARIERSVASFERRAARADECYMFALVEASSGRVAGISAIEAAVGLAEPWYHFRLGTLVHASRALGVYTKVPTLFLSNDHTGQTELASLFVDADFRRGGSGALVAKSRFLFIAEFADRFAPKVIAELRGKLAPDGTSAFWEGLGRHFFAMEFSQADYLTGMGQKAFIAELMPHHPLYVNLLSPAAREVIGVVHDDTRAARALLEQEGFRYEGYVDIFDAGPTLESFRHDIDAVRASRVMQVVVDEPADASPLRHAGTRRVRWLVANRRFADWRTLLVEAPVDATIIRLTGEEASLLGIDADATVRAVPLSPADRPGSGM